jgi:hypothetical protein
MTKWRLAPLLGMVAGIACAGDRWEVTATAVAPDGTSQRHTELQCLPAGVIDPLQLLGGTGNCVFDRKSGSATALHFALTCKTPGLPPELASMKVVGDAHLAGDRFDMRYAVTAGDSSVAAGADFSMNGTAEGRRLGDCTE